MVTVRVREMQTERRYELSGDDPMRRVPYDVWQATGPIVEADDGLMHYTMNNGEQIARTRPGHLAECHPGERVLVHLPDGSPDVHEWWLCEVETVGAVAAD